MSKNKKPPSDKTSTKPPIPPKDKEPKPLDFTMKPVKEKPSRKYKKGSKYDPVLDQFITSGDTLVQVTIKDIDSNYLRTQLNNRISKRKLNLKTSVLNNQLYLEKT